MLKQRILTALLLLPVALLVVLLAPLWLFTVVLLVVVALLAAEFAALCTDSPLGRTLFIAVAVMLTGAGTLEGWGMPAVAQLLLVFAVALWLLAPAWFLGRQRLSAAVKLFLGVFLLAGAGIALHQLKAVSPDGRWVLFVLVLVWAADVGAYAAGRLLGKHKLAPSISPGKTWEGFFGGLLLTLLVGVLAGLWLLGIALRPEWLILLAAIAIISVIGDLLESLLKRQAGVKDSGKLLPGHGGVLDRLDSLLAAAPLFLLAGTRIGIFGGVSGFGV